MSRPTKPKPLAAEIARVLRSVEKLAREGHNDDGDYDYTRATDVFAAVRDKLFAAGILLLPDESEPSYVAIQTNGGETLTECRLGVSYTFTNGTESLPPLRCNGIGRTKDEKALYIAQTGAEKAFLKRIGLMAEQVDDPEFEEEESATGETIDDAAPMRSPKRKREQPIRDFEITALEDAFADTHKTPAEVSEGLLTRFKIAQLPDLKRYQFKEALAWASNGAGTLAPKPQAAPAQQKSMYFPTPVPPTETKFGNKSTSLESVAADKHAFSI